MKITVEQFDFIKEKLNKDDLQWLDTKQEDDEKMLINQLQSRMCNRFNDYDNEFFSHSNNEIEFCKTLHNLHRFNLLGMSKTIITEMQKSIIDNGIYNIFSIRLKIVQVPKNSSDFNLVVKK